MVPMALSTPYKIAGGMVILAVVWFGGNTLVKGVTGVDRDNPDQVADDDGVFTVMTSRTASREWQESVSVRGRTKAFRKVTVRTETAGTVSETPTSIGSKVNKGDTLCRLRIDARQSQLDQARASLAKAKLDYNAASELMKEGLGSENAVAAAKAARDLSQAGVLQAQIAVQQTIVSAPFDGTFDQRMVEAGDYVKVGDPCGVLIQRDPFLIVGAISEREVGKIAPGDRGVATLATGEIVEGKVKFVASSADPSTRTFDVELEVPNSEGTLRDGVTAEFQITAQRRNAHLVKRSALVLDANERIGVRVVDENSLVQFIPVNLLGESRTGIFVDGLSDAVELITRGQEYVKAGQRVKVARDEQAPSTVNEGVQ